MQIQDVRNARQLLADADSKIGQASRLFGTTGTEDVQAKLTAMRSELLDVALTLNRAERVMTARNVEHMEDLCGKFDGVCVRPRGHKGGCSNPAPEDSANIPCRCGGDVRSCRKGCRLWACCGGYVREGHMTDCPGASGVIVEGVR
jgi:hypothetical protein